jgi:lysyl-tRNA synthetase class 2
MFIDLVDMTGKIQVYIKNDELRMTNDECISFDNLNLLDSGDVIEVYGLITKTQSGEISIQAETVRLLTKAIRPLPTDLEDKEERYRRRYLDMTLHPEIRERFVRRSKFWQATRDFMNENGFVEVNIPVLEHTTGGADAKPFVTHYDALNEDFYLRISHELPLKRLLGAGFHKVYDLGPRFRNEGFSDEHLPEHIAMEWYWAYADYRDGMKLTQEVFKYIMEKVYGILKFNMKGFEVDLSGEWEEIDYTTIIKERFGVDIFNDPVEKMTKILKENKVDLGDDVNRMRAVDNLWKLIRKTVGGPSFLVGVPKFMSPLAKTNPKNPELTERFLALIAGTEMTNAYSELNDPLDQLERFMEQEALRVGGDDEAQMLDIDYVEMLEYGMPPACGYGMSERVFWFFENVTAKEGVPFPQLRHDIDDLTKKIYPNIEFDKKEEAEPQLKDEVITGLPSYEDAEKLLEKHVKDDYQKHHAHMVANGLKAYAEKFGGNTDLWYLSGLLHDLDYFEHPAEHPNVAVGWFKEWGYSSDLIHAVAAHDHLNTGVNPVTKLAKALIAVDEMSGLLYAYSLMRPERFEGMEVKSVVKKFKDKNFAAKISREEIELGMKLLGVSLEEHAAFLIEVFKKMNK